VGETVKELRIARLEPGEEGEMFKMRLEGQEEAKLCLQAGLHSTLAMERG
jgi:hypothetical protein